MSEFSHLFLKIITGQSTDEENGRLREWASTKRRLDFVKMVTDPEELTREYRLRRVIDSSRAEADMKRRIAKIEAPRRRLRFIYITTVAAAVAGIVWMITSHLSNNQSLSTYQNDIIAEASREIRHGETKALIRNERGGSIILSGSDSLASHLLALSQPEEFSHPTSANKLLVEVPRGGEFKIILEDSTEVWLNSQSTLQYPAKFDEKERIVKITGEAYFAVRKDETRPFYVIAGEQKIRVYGTTFNIRDYADDNLAYTTLETGQISLSLLTGNGGELFLKPNHQAIFNKDDDEVTMREVDASRISEWRYGRFVFEGQTLLNIMRDLSRWYNFEYEFSDASISDIRFTGNIPRYADFTTVITILENCGDICFATEGSRVIISHIP